MADPLSIIASIAGLAATGAQLTVQVYQFISSIRSASRDLQDLGRELGELCSILQKLEKKFSSGVRHQELWVDLKDVLDSCTIKFSQLGALVKTHKIEAKDRWILRQWKRGKWVFQEKEVSSLRTELEAHKATLTITLILSTHMETTSIKDTTDRIEETVRDAINKLIKNGDTGSVATRHSSSFVLQRYLSSAASVFSSRPSSPINEGQINPENIVKKAETLKAQPIISCEPEERNANAESTRVKADTNIFFRGQAIAEKKQKSIKETEEANIKTEEFRKAKIQAIRDRERAKYEAMDKERAEEDEKKINQAIEAERAKMQIIIEWEREKWESKNPKRAETLDQAPSKTSADTQVTRIEQK